METNIAELVFEALDIKPVYRIAAPGTLEGGDYVPFTDSHAFIGQGLRTNAEGVRQLLNPRVLGPAVKLVSVVKDATDCSQDRMHLDTYFNVLNDKAVVLLETLVPGRKGHDPAKHPRFAHHLTPG
jgi:arginine deiminase